jgi:hypothetical protein
MHCTLLCGNFNRKKYTITLIREFHRLAAHGSPSVAWRGYAMAPQWQSYERRMING